MNRSPDTHPTNTITSSQRFGAGRRLTDQKPYSLCGNGRVPSRSQLMIGRGSTLEIDGGSMERLRRPSSGIQLFSTPSPNCYKRQEVSSRRSARSVWRQRIVSASSGSADARIEEKRRMFRHNSFHSSSKISVNGASGYTRRSRI
jgi:hypothetical protein